MELVSPNCTKIYKDFGAKGTNANTYQQCLEHVYVYLFYSFTLLHFATAARVPEEVDVLVTVPVLDEEDVLVVDKVIVSDVVLLDVVNVAVILLDVLEEALVVVLLDVVGLMASSLYRNQSLEPWLV